MFRDSDDIPASGVVQINVTGKSPELWDRLRHKFMAAVEQVLDAIADANRGTTVRDEAKSFTSLMLENFRSRLRTAGLENTKIEAEVVKLYAECEAVQASARKTNAEAAAIELGTAVRRFELGLRLARGLLVGDSGEEAVIFSSQIEAMLEAIKEARPLLLTEESSGA